MTFKNNRLLYLLILCSSSGIFSHTSWPYQLYSLGSHHKIKNGRATVFIHGTTNIVPLIEPLLGRFIDTWLDDRAKTLCDAWPLECTPDSVYIFRWPGEFDIKVRKKAARCLYNAIYNHTGPLTIIAHSHGCSIALYLAELCRKHKNTTFKVDKLILLAAPVQEATAPLVSSKIFKQVFSLYSSADVLQIIAPQRLTRTSNKKRRKVLCRSQRIFPASPNLIQARILMNYQSPSHYDFCSQFLQKLPSVVNFLEQNCRIKKGHVIVNVPTNTDRPSFLQKDELNNLYLRRIKRKRRRVYRFAR